MTIQDRIIPLSNLPQWRQQLREKGLRLVATNGCFDVIHAGHTAYLQAARQHGDVLLVGLNGDDAVKILKGPERPINPQEDRAAVLAALRSVDAVCIFPEPRATAFLAAASPDVYVKGGDYTLETLDPGERKVIEDARAKIVFIPFLPGRSTTALLQRSSRS